MPDADRKLLAGLIRSPRQAADIFPFYESGNKRDSGRKLTSPQHTVAWSPMRPNVPTAFRRVHVWEEFCIYFEKRLEGAETHGTLWGTQMRWNSLLSTFTTVCFHFFFTICFTVSLLSVLEWLQCTSFVGCHSHAGNRLICTECVLSFHTCLPWFHFSFAAELHCLMQLLSAAVNSQNSLFLLFCDWQGP